MYWGKMREEGREGGERESEGEVGVHGRKGGGEEGRERKMGEGRGRGREKGGRGRGRERGGRGGGRRGGSKAPQPKHHKPDIHVYVLYVLCGLVRCVSFLFKLVYVRLSVMMGRLPDVELGLRLA